MYTIYICRIVCGVYSAIYINIFVNYPFVHVNNPSYIYSYILHLYTSRVFTGGN
jgi:hypothetical protein